MQQHSTDEDTLRRVDVEKLDDLTESSPTSSPNAESTRESQTKSETSWEPPNGGLLAWSAVVAGWHLFVISWGPSLAFGVFQEFYQTEYLANYSASSISWIGGLQAFLLLSTGALCGPLFD